MAPARERAGNHCFRPTPRTPLRQLHPSTQGLHQHAQHRIYTAGCRNSDARLASDAEVGPSGCGNRPRSLREPPTRLTTLSPAALLAISFGSFDRLWVWRSLSGSCRTSCGSCSIGWCRRRRPVDKGYDHDHLGRWLRARGITPPIARKGEESSRRLGPAADHRTHHGLARRTSASAHRRYERRASHFWPSPASPAPSSATAGSPRQPSVAIRHGLLAGHAWGRDVVPAPGVDDYCCWTRWISGGRGRRRYDGAGA